MRGSRAKSNVEDETKPSVVKLQLSKEDQRMIRVAGALQNKSMTRFILDSALEAARSVTAKINLKALPDEP